MRIDDEGIGYTWEDLRPIHRLIHVETLTQFLGAIIGFVILRDDYSVLQALVRGACIATFPGFVLGFIYQAVVRFDAIRENRGMVAFGALLSAFVSIVGYAVPPQS